MGGDQTRFTFKPEQHYASVLMQQGRVQLDSDWNEAQAIGDRRWRAETLDLVGQAGVPDSTPDAFHIQSDGAGSLTIGLGRLYVDGLLAENHGLPPLQYNAQLGELYGTTPTPYDSQPYCPNPPDLSTPVGTTDLLYLDVWQREVTIIEDPALREVALLGPDTTTRLQTVWQVKALTDVGSTTCGASLPQWEDLTRPSAGRLSTVANKPLSNTDPCIIPPKAGYRGLENRLYRVEVHVGGALGTAKFKWSRDNGSIMSAVEGISAGRDRLTVQRIGRDVVLRFKIGDWVEVLDDYVEFSENPVGHLAQVADIDEANRVLVLNPDIPGSFDFPTDATQATVPERHTRVRRWDQRAPQNTLDANGLMTVSAGPVNLEDGIQISFSVDGAIGTDFKVGDAWVFAARSADASVELLDQAPPRTTLHHYARLALVTQTADEPLITDCRTIFPGDRCCVVVRPGEDIQAVIDKLCVTGGCICLAAGLHVLHRPLVIDGCKNLTIHGAGNATRLVYQTADAEPDTAMIYIVGGSQSIEMADFLAFSDDLDVLIAVDEGSRLVTFKQLTLVNGNTDSITNQRSPSTCILLGNCCRVSVTQSTLLGSVGILQTEADRLQSLHKRIDQLRSPTPELKATAPPPPAVRPMTGLICRDNVFYVLSIGIFLNDALDGVIQRNRMQGLPSTLTLKGDRDEQERITRAVQHTSLIAKLDTLLGLLACPTAKVPVAPLRTVGIFACLLDRFEIAENQIWATRGIYLSFAREVVIRGNRIEFLSPSKSTQIKGETLRSKDAPSLGSTLSSGHSSVSIFPKTVTAIAIAFGFEVTIEGNTLRSIPVARTTFDPDELLLRDRVQPGHMGIALGSTRGIVIRENTIRASSGIATVRWIISSSQVRAAADYPTSLVRVLRLGTVWRVVVELAWVLWQFIRIAQQQNSSTPTGASSDADPTTRTQFAQKLLKGGVTLLSDPDLLPNFVGKATIAHNQMQVARFGVCFPSVFTVGGLEVLGNRISGFTETGILIHPWLSVSFPDLTAQWVYCGLEWILEILHLLREALDGMLKGNPQPKASTPDWTVAEIGTSLVSWVVSFCAKYCGKTTPPTEEPDDEEPERSPSEDLKDALDDLLDTLDLTWLDDLVNQSYVIDSNTLRGHGDGIWVGIDGTQISHNHITIHPDNGAAFEAMALAFVLRSVKLSGGLSLLPFFLIEGDRDLMVAAAVLVNLTSTANLGLPVEQLRASINQFLAFVAPTSPLQTATLALRNALQPSAPDLGAIKSALVALLQAIAQQTKGYGIAMMGADMTCIHNQVWGSTSCGIEALTNRGSAPVAMVKNPRVPRVVPYPAIAGIWHFSNFLSLIFEALALQLNQSEGIAETQRGPGRTLKLLSLVIAQAVLAGRRDRSLHVQSNVVEKALIHGIRTLDVTGLEEVSIYDNMVKDASRYAIYHQSLIDQDAKCYVKIHRNTATRTSAVFDLLTTILNRF